MNINGLGNRNNISRWQQEGMTTTQFINQLRREIVKQQGRPLSTEQTTRLNELIQRIKNEFQLRD